MAFTYTLPLATDAHKVRFMIGDTDSTDVLLADEEITYLLTVKNSLTLVAADACDAIAAKFSRQATFSNLSLSVSANQRAEAYRKRAEEWRSKSAQELEVFFGGQSIGAKDSLNADADAVLPHVSIGEDDMFGNEDDPSRRWR